MRKYITTNGDIVMVREEVDDIIATLEQENRQLRARNERLEREKCTPLNEAQVHKMWDASSEDILRFARMVESFHGVGGAYATR